MDLCYGRNANLTLAVCFVTVYSAVALSGCGGPASRSSMSFESPDPSVRALAGVCAANHGDQSAVPRLVDRLEDEDEAVRFYAILALEKLTGTRLSYRYGGSEVTRRAGVERWRRFLVESWDGGETSEVSTGR